MDMNKIRNIAIIAHVDHGKTTLVDQMFKQSGMFRDNQVVSERLMDSMDQEKERGITIMAKNGAFKYQDYWVNIIDTPGHADFGGQVECVLKMADGVLLLVDAAEGPMPQTYFVLKKALHLHLPVIVVINKIDKPNARCEWVVDQVFDLMAKLEAPDHIMDFPVIYTSAKDGYAVNDYKDKGENMKALYEKIINCIPSPKGNSEDTLQMLVSLLQFSSFLGRLAVGKISAGKISVNQDICVTRDGIHLAKSRVTKIYHFLGNELKPIESAHAGEIVAVAGIEHVTMGETITDPNNPKPMDAPMIDPPTITMNFLPNDSPLSGQEGQFVSSRHLKERLERETLSDVALKVEDLTTEPGCKVSGRGELHLSVLIEKMRREGYELQVTMPRVIFKEENGKKLEPYEELTIDVSEDAMGKVIENLGSRKGIMLDMKKEHDLVRLIYKIPTRGFLGFRSEFMTITKGMGTISSIFFDYDDFASDMKKRENGVLISIDDGVTAGYSLFNLQSRGVLFLGSGEKVYHGQILGSHSRDNDLVVNACRGKKMSNMRASGSDDAITLTPHKRMSLEDCLSFIADDELVEVTPKSIRLRKKILDENGRKRSMRE
jgi:GTP-binding protein